MKQRFLALGGILVIGFLPTLAAAEKPCDGVPTATITIDYDNGGGSVSPSSLEVFQDEEICWELSAPLRAGERLLITSDTKKTPSQGNRVPDPYEAKGRGSKDKRVKKDSGMTHVRTEKADAHGTWVYKVAVKKRARTVAEIDPEVIIKTRP